MKSMLLLAVAAVVLAGMVRADNGLPRVALETSKGTIVVELDLAKAPKTVESFLDNVDAGFYDGTIFHRVIENFMIQGGGFSPDMQLKPTMKALNNEADNGLKNLRGTIAMARKGEPHSASVQFFINTVDNVALDHRDQTPQGWGYAVFGKVVDGMDVVDAIEAVDTGNNGPFRDVPTEPVIIESARRVEAPASE